MPVLAAIGVTKRYGEAVALDGVDFAVEPGEVHALLGENGSGKSTLCKVLFAAPEILQSGGLEGSVTLDGRPVSFAGPAEALDAGVGLVHQELSLAGDLTVAENVTLGIEPVRGAGPLSPVDRERAEALARDALAGIGAAIEPSTPLRDLPIGAWQLVETARETSRAALRVLLLDEPSTALSAAEADGLAKMVRSLADAGVGVVLVTHRVPEALALADRVTVLRDGRVAASVPVSEADPARVAAWMVGDAAQAGNRTRRRTLGGIALSLEELVVSLPGDPLRALSLDVRAGEIVGVTSQAGHGRLALAAGLLGLARSTGRVTVAGTVVRPGTPGEALRSGLVVIHEQRDGVVLAPDESVAFNLFFASAVAGRGFVRSRRLPGGGLLDLASMERASEDIVERLGIRCSSVRQPVRELSGGNRQKVVIGQALAAEPRALVVAEPTRGIDVVARQRVHEELRRLADSGVAVLVVSGDAGELAVLADRIVVLRGGRAVAEHTAPFDPVRLELAVLGEGIG